MGTDPANSGIVTQPYIATSNERNELGRVQVELHTPFRGATSDMGQCGVRCNLDIQFMPRAPVLADDESMGDEGHGAEKPAIDLEENAEGHSAETPETNLVANAEPARS